MDPISLAASVWGLLGAGERVISFLSSIPDVPNAAANVLTECHALCAIFVQLNDFISDQDQQSMTRKSRISLNYLVATLTGCMTAFSELDKVLRSLGAPMDGNDGSSYQFTFIDKLKWMLKEKSIEKILRNMQMHKNSLNFMVLIYLRSVVTYFDFTSSSPFKDDFYNLYHLAHHTTAPIASCETGRNVCFNLIGRCGGSVESRVQIQANISDEQRSLYEICSHRVVFDSACRSLPFLLLHQVRR